MVRDCFQVGILLGDPCIKLVSQWARVPMGYNLCKRLNEKQILCQKQKIKKIFQSLNWYQCRR